jgi:hypothetical protein
MIGFRGWWLIGTILAFAACSGGGGGTDTAASLDPGVAADPAGDPGTPQPDTGGGGFDTTGLSCGPAGKKVSDFEDCDKLAKAVHACCLQKQGTPEACAAQVPAALTVPCDPKSTDPNFTCKPAFLMSYDNGACPKY